MLERKANQSEAQVVDDVPSFMAKSRWNNLFYVNVEHGAL